jgi:hypothetical protein
MPGGVSPHMDDGGQGSGLVLGRNSGARERALPVSQEGPTRADG